MDKNIVTATLVRNGWLSPDGTLHQVEDDFGHTEYAYQAMGMTAPEHNGWLHISHNAVRYVQGAFGVRITQAQLDTLWDMYMSGRNYPPIAWVRNALDDLRSLLDIRVTD